MPLPFILGAAALAAAVNGVKSGAEGIEKMKEADNTMKRANERHKSNLARFESMQKATTDDMDKLGKLELRILESFKLFSDTIEKIHNRPDFKKISKDGVNIPKYDGEELKKVSIGAGVLLGSIGSAVGASAGGIAAAGAATSAVMALGTASTGTAIASLSGAAATNATLAALGGGALGSSALAGGMALGSTILGAASLGVGLLVGGAIFKHTGANLSNKADEAWDQMKKAEAEIDKSCSYMEKLSEAASAYRKSLNAVDRIYAPHLNSLQNIVNVRHKTDWNQFTYSEQLCTENTVLLVGLLYAMCKVKLVQEAASKNTMHKVNAGTINYYIRNARQFVTTHDFTLRV